MRKVVTYALVLALMLVLAFAVNTYLARANDSGGFLGKDREDSSHEASISILAQADPPPPENWILLATDPDEEAGTSLKNIYGQVYSGILYFKVEHWRSWTTIDDIDTGIFIDADQDPSTGCPDGTYPGQNTGIGADYVIVVGWEGTEMLKWDPDTDWWDLANPIPLAYLDAPDNTNVFIVGVYLTDLEANGAIDGAVADVESDWDWMPDTGHFTFQLAAPVGGIIVSESSLPAVNPISHNILITLIAVIASVSTIIAVKTQIIKS